MADALNIDDTLKTGYEELLLGNRVVTRCGARVQGLLANHLVVLCANNTTVPLVDFIRNGGQCTGSTPSQTAPQTVFVIHDSQLN